MAHPSEQDLKSEIEYIKEMAQGGDKSTIKIGKFLYFLGLLIISYYLFEEFVLSGITHYFAHNNSPNFLSQLHHFFYKYVPYFASAIFIFYIFLFKKQLFDKNRIPSSAIAAKSVWFAVLLFLIFEYASDKAFYFNNRYFESIAQISDIILQSSGTKQNFFRDLNATIQMQFAPIHLLTIFGAAWWICADVSKYYWLRYFSIAAFLASPIYAYFFNILHVNPPIYIIFLVAIFLLLPASKINKYENN